MTECGEEMFQLYIQMRHEKIQEKELLNEFRKYINEHVDDNSYMKSVNLLKNFLKELDHWLPSGIDSFEHSDIDSTNRVEGFFGNLKEILPPYTYKIYIQTVF